MFVIGKYVIIQEALILPFLDFSLTFKIETFFLPLSNKDFLRFETYR